MLGPEYAEGGTLAPRALFVSSGGDTLPNGTAVSVDVDPAYQDDTSSTPAVLSATNMVFSHFDVMRRSGAGLRIGVENHMLNVLLARETFVPLGKEDGAMEKTGFSLLAAAHLSGNVLAAYGEHLGREGMIDPRSLYATYSNFSPLFEGAGQSLDIICRGVEFYYNHDKPLRGNIRYDLPSRAMRDARDMPSHPQVWNLAIDPADPLAQRRYTWYLLRRWCRGSTSIPTCARRSLAL